MPAPSVIDQLAFLEMLNRGSYDRHLRWARRRYRTRREALLTALDRRLPDWPISGAPAGLHFVLHLPDGATPATTTALLGAAAAREVVLADLARYCLNPGHAAAAVVVGYANLADTAVAQVVDHLAAASPSTGL